MVKETESLRKFREELKEIKAKQRVTNSRLNILEEDSQQKQQAELPIQKQGNREDDLIEQYQEETESPIQKQDVVEQEATVKEILIYEIAKKPEDALTLEDVYTYIQNNNYDHICDSMKKIKLFGRLEKITGSTTNPMTDKTIPAKIIIVDSTGRRIRGVVWSKTLEGKLTQLLQCWIIFSEVYFRQVKDRYLSKNFTIFEILNKLENRLERKQFEFQVNKCRIFRVKTEGTVEQ